MLIFGVARVVAARKWLGAWWWQPDGVLDMVAAVKQQSEPRKQAKILIFGVARVVVARKWLWAWWQRPDNGRGPKMSIRAHFRALGWQ